jgi:hypothetical protein
LRGFVERGDDPRQLLAPPASATVASAKHAAREALRSGDGVRSFSEYSELERLGQNKAYNLLGKALSCLVEGDLVGSRGFIENFDIRYGTPMAVNICAIYCLMDVAAGTSDVDFSNLDRARSEAIDFKFSLSPLVDLKAGLEAKNVSFLMRANEVFSRVSD